MLQTLCVNRDLSMDVYELIQGLQSTDNNLIQRTAELNKAIDHIVQLTQAPSSLYLNDSYPSSAFLSITACEEVAKACIGSFTDGQYSERKGRNIFRNQKTKHQMAAMPTVPMGQRLEDALGKVELHKIMNMAHNAGFVQARENALYF